MGNISIPPYLGRVLGLAVVAVAIAVAAESVSSGSSNSFWVFLRNAVTPVGIGILVLMTAERMNSQKGR